jgi:hypothetical protein
VRVDNELVWENREVAWMEVPADAGRCLSE